jgi:hypothetical protein
MDKWTFGFTLLIVGVGGTFLTLWILSLLMILLKKILPLLAEDGGAEKKS